MTQTFKNCGHKRTMRKLSHILHLFCLTFLLAAGCSYTKDLTVLTRKQAAHDLDYIVKNVKAIHPDPFTHVSEEVFDARSEQIKAGIGDTISRKDFSLGIAELLALLCDPHTGHYDFPDFVSFYNSGGKIFPVKLRLKNGSVIVVSWQKALEPKHMKKGDLVVAINKKPMQSLLQQYGKYLPTTRPPHQNWMLEQRLHYFLWLIEEEDEFFELTLMNSSGEEYHEIISAISAVTSKEQNKMKESEFFRFDFYLDNRVCFFKARSFQDNLYKPFVKNFEALVSEMKTHNTSILIVDLRGNNGGSGKLPYQLLRRTINNPVLESPGGRLIRPGSKSWNGTLVLLCDRGTVSAAVYPVVIVKDSKAGVVVGEETGGRASYFGNVRSIRLPNSHLRCQIATRYFRRPAGYDDGRGVLPDLPLDVTLEDCVLVKKIYNHIKNNGN